MFANIPDKKKDVCESVIMKAQQRDEYKHHVEQLIMTKSKGELEKEDTKM